MIVISPDQLTPDDLELISEILNDYLEYFDPEEEAANGVENPASKHDAVESLYGRIEGIDFSEMDVANHHPDCGCEWCELARMG
jgi:hypothetical protein